MKKLFYFDRKARAKQEEPVFCARTLQFLYASTVGKCFEWLLSHSPLFSFCIGWFYKTSWSRRKIQSFVQTYGINSQEFTKKISEYVSFNDFFTRKLKMGARPIAAGEAVCIAPADGAYLVIPNIQEHTCFGIKARHFCLEQFLKSTQLAEKYAEGSMVIARLAPFDYHRFHFPFDCEPSASRLINGYLHSVHPMALRNNFNVFCENKRTCSFLESDLFGTVVFVEVGAFGVGSIVQTYTPNEKYRKGDEKGFFEFGGSTIVMLFQAKMITFDQDLITASSLGIETRCLMGETLGKVCVA